MVTVVIFRTGYRHWDLAVWLAAQEDTEKLWEEYEIRMNMAVLGSKAHMSIATRCQCHY